MDNSKRNVTGSVALDAVMSKFLCGWVKSLQELVASDPKQTGVIFEQRVNVSST
jgi:hypothetical protein